VVTIQDRRCSEEATSIPTAQPIARDCGLACFQPSQTPQLTSLVSAFRFDGFLVHAAQDFEVVIYTVVSSQQSLSLCRH
jgi:hypothetical protein